MDARLRWIDVLLVSIALCVAGVLRWHYVDASPSFDELWHLALSAGRGSPLGTVPPDTVVLDPIRQTGLAGAPAAWRVWTGMDGVLHPPLYVITLRLWRDAFGEGDRVAHAYSIAWSLVAIAFLYATARLTMDRGVAFLLALAMAYAQTQIYFAQEIRGYAMLVALGTIALWWMTRIELLGPTPRRAAVLASLTVPILLTHYFGAGVALAIATYGLVALVGHRRRFAGWLSVFALFYGLIWVPFAYQQLDDLGTGDAFLSSPRDGLSEMLMLLCAPFRMIADRDYHTERTPLLSGVLLVLPWLMLRRFPPLRPWAIYLTLALVPLAALDLARGTIHLALVRYLAASTPAVFLLFVGIVWPVRRRLAYAVAGALAFGGFVYQYSGNRVGQDSSNFAAVIAALEARIAPGEPIIAYHGQSPLFYGDVFVMTASHAATLFPRPVVNATRPLSPELTRRLASPTAWVIAGRLEGDPTQLIPGAHELERIVVHEEVTLYRFALPTASGDQIPPPATAASAPTSAAAGTP